MKKCPYCAEEIQDDAVKCRWCNEFIKKKRKLPGCLSCCLVTFFSIFLGTLLLVFLSSLFLKFVMHKIFFEPAAPYYDSPAALHAESFLHQFEEWLGFLWQRLRMLFPLTV